jgi:hypothetical protein
MAMNEDIQGAGGGEGVAGASGASQGQSGAEEADSARDARLAQIYKLSSSDHKLYRSEAVQNELEALEIEKRGAPGPDKVQDDEAADGEDGSGDGAEGTAGVPEMADGYVIPEVDGHQWDSRQRGEIGDFLKDAHEAGFTQAQIDLALTALARSNLNLAQVSPNGRAEETAKTTEQELRKIWKGAYQANRTLANEEAMAIWGDHAPDVANIRLQDGSFLGDSRWFVEGLSKLAARSAGRGAQEQPGSSEAQSSEDRLNYLYSLQTKNYKQYKTPKIQDEIKQLEAEKLSRRGR